MRDVGYWPATFMDEVESTPVERGVRLWALGGPSFLYRTPRTTIWLDPYFGGTPDDAVPGAYRATAIPINPAEVRRADLILSTHDHVDHCHRETILPIMSQTGATCLAAPSSAALARGWGVPEERVRAATAGETIQVNDVTLHVYPSYDPNEPRAVTFVLESDGTALFVSGDTWDGPALAEIGQRHTLDLALLAFGRTWYMAPDDLIAAARRLRPRALLPFHWEFWRNHTGDLGQLFEVYHRERPPFAMHLLLIGDSIQVPGAPD